MLTAAVALAASVLAQPGAPVPRGDPAATLTRLRGAARPLTGSAADYDPLLRLVGDARLVLLGEGSHGTHEFYRARAEITRRLVSEKDFTAVAVEGDWPDAYRVNRFVRGAPGDAGAREALAGFRRFPTWMWRNTEVLDFVGWLRRHNEAVGPGAAKVGFYGLDLYSLPDSAAAVVAYLEGVDPGAGRRARARYACIGRHGPDPEDYGLAVASGEAPSCRGQAVDQLAELGRNRLRYGLGGPAAGEAFFEAEQNARVVRNAEGYYRAALLGEESSWNLRDRHMAETLEAVSRHLSRPGRPAKIVVWAHNSHVGDARATELGEAGELNIGQLVRERYGREVVLVGFTTHTGTVTAASDWGLPAERKRVRPALEGSYERLFHEVGLPAFLLDLRGDPELEGLRQPRLERAIGVIYLPQTERQSHYFGARLADQFDAVIHFDETRAVEPLEPDAGWERGEEPTVAPLGR